MAIKSIRIESKAPTRIDLAGGTVDIWPIYLFLNQPRTINLGIDLFAETVLEETPVKDGKGSVTLRSGDQSSELKIRWDELETLQPPPYLELHTKLLRFFAREKSDKGNFTLTTRAKSPAGAGLGGSSTLSISMIGALATWARGSVDPVRDGEKFIEIVRDTETTVIQVPAGMQDYYGAMYGGLQVLRWGAGTHQREWLPEATLTAVQDRLLLFYSGQSRNSGINNWALFKAFIDKSGDVRNQFGAIAEATRQLETALLQSDWQKAGAAIGDEWNVRQTLAAGISTPEMDRAFELAKKEGAASGKVCGAGGGGCFFVFVPSGSSGVKARIVDKITALGIRHLPFSATPRGLEVKVMHA